MPLALLLVAGAAVAAWPVAGQPSQFLPVTEIRPGMVGIGRTVFTGANLEEFRANILGVLRNVIAPGRDLIVARLEGGPLAQTGVIQGMSGSPVYVDGRLIGAVSYSLGSFPREPIAGITPIAEMVDAMRATSDRPSRGEFDLTWPATPDQVFGALSKVAARAATPLRSPLRPVDVVGAPSLADWAPRLRPIGAAMMARGLTSGVRKDLEHALGAPVAELTGGQSDGSTAPLRPGDPIGMTFLRGDLEMGATGTVTHVDGAQVYAFGHAFLQQGPTTMPMTRAQVLTVLPSLESSMKIGEMGPVIGRMTQDRSVGVGGVLGPGPDELDVTITLHASDAAVRTFNFHVVHDQSLTPLFAFVSMLNALSSWERPAGPTTIGVKGEVDFGAQGRITIDDTFTGDTALTQAATTVLTPLGALAANSFRPLLPSSMRVDLNVSEEHRYATIERAWLDTVRPTAGSTHTLHVQLRHYRGPTETVSLPITMPAQSTGPLTLLVSDAAGVATLEDQELRPQPPASLDALWARLQESRANHFVHVRLTTGASGVSAAGQSQPSLPSSVQAVFDADRSTPAASLSRAIVGRWQIKVPTVVFGSREIAVTVHPQR